MNTVVRYYSRSGNTEKLAKSIAERLKCDCESISSPAKEKIDVLFLGSSVYAGGFDAAVGKFLKDNAGKIGLIVCFGSSASGRSTYNKIKNLAEECNIKVFGEYYNCPGHFMFLHKARPNNNDLKKAADFAEETLNKLK